MATIIDEITRKNETEHGWRYALRLDDQQVVVGFWWQSPTQVNPRLKWPSAVILTF
jgi:RecB family exonuclease